MTVEGSTIKSRLRNMLRSPSNKLDRNCKQENIENKVRLERVLGITASGNCGLVSDPRSGLVAYPAGCVVVLLSPKKNKQLHILNTSRKAITALSFSPDGRYLVTGESGHLPAVRVWDVAERRQVGELQEHKYGVSCVAFSPNSKYIVSVGYQHDMMINVWAWKKDTVVAANKVSSKVTAVSFSDDSSYFVTAGIRHVKYWYLDHSKHIKTSAPIPLLGRSGLLGELRNNFFCDVACGRGSKSADTFCITSSGLLCVFNSKRTLDKWVDLRTSVARSLCVSEELIFCGCADGTVRAFSPADLQFVGTLPRPHPLGTDVSAITQASHLFSNKIDARYPDTVAVTYDPVSHWLSCAYSDHSLYVWDVRDLLRVGKVHSALFHAACVWDLEVFPELPEAFAAGLSSGVFISCAADNTMRLWNMEGPSAQPNVLSNDLLKVIYMDENLGALLDTEGSASGSVEKAEGQTADSRVGFRTISVRPDGKHLASGDRNGVLRVHDLSSMEEILKVEAHDSEILCLEYSKPETGLNLLASAGRDRLIHVLDADRDYGLLQTLDEHSSSITAVRFASNENKVRMISCGADKSIYFRTAHKTGRGTEFRCSHHVVRKTTLYDMGVDPTCKYAAVGCQDRCIRIFNISTGKQKKLYKGSQSEDGSLLKVQMDPSGLFVATSCSDKNISIFDFLSGECVATMFGHSEIVTGMKFTNDCKYLLSVSGDSCIFVWRLAPEMTLSMRQRLSQLRHLPNPQRKTSPLRREIHSAPSLGGVSSESDHDNEEEGPLNYCPDQEEKRASTSSDSSHDGEEDTDESQDLDSNKKELCDSVAPEAPARPRRRWSCRMGSLELMFKSMLDLRQLEAFSLHGSSHKKGPASQLREKDAGSTSSLQGALEMEERTKKAHRLRPHSDWLSSTTCKGFPGADGNVFYPEGSEDTARLLSSDYLVKEQQVGCAGRGGGFPSAGCPQDSQSPDSACSVDYDSRESSPDQAHEESDGTAPLTSEDDQSELEDDGEEGEVERGKAERGKAEGGKVEVTSMDEAMRTVSAAAELPQESFLKQNFETLDKPSSMAERSRAARLSMSARFLARGSNNNNPRRTPLFTKAHKMDMRPGGSPAQPLVSKVRPLMEGGRGQDLGERSPIHSTLEAQKSVEAGAPERGPVLRSHPQKRRPLASQLWRMSSPASGTRAQAERAATPQKSQSVQNLTSEGFCYPAPSFGQREARPRPQHFLMDRDPSRPLSRLSSPLTTSPSSPVSPVPWESPKIKSLRSYMSPTTSSKAKSSPSSASSSPLPLEDGGGEPASRRSSDDLEVELPFFSSPPTSPSPRCPRPNRFCASPPRGAVSPDPSLSSPINVPPSRIPLPKQPLTLRHSLCLDLRPHSDWPAAVARTSSPVEDPGCDCIAGSVRKQGLGKRLSLPTDQAKGNVQRPVSPASLPVHQERFLDSQKRFPGQEPLLCKDRPLVSVQAFSLTTTESQPGSSVSVEDCRQAAAELHSALRKTTQLYMMVLGCGSAPSEEQQEMRRVLGEALDLIRAELDSLPQIKARGEASEARGGGVKGEGALALLEQYSELLLKSVEKRLDNKT